MPACLAPHGLLRCCGCPDLPLTAPIPAGPPGTAVSAGRLPAAGRRHRLGGHPPGAAHPPHRRGGVGWAAGGQLGRLACLQLGTCRMGWRTEYMLAGQRAKHKGAVPPCPDIRQQASLNARPASLFSPFPHPLPQPGPMSTYPLPLPTTCVPPRATCPWLASWAGPLPRRLLEPPPRPAPWQAAAAQASRARATAPAAAQRQQRVRRMGPRSLAPRSPPPVLLPWRRAVCCWGSGITMCAAGTPCRPSSSAPQPCHPAVPSTTSAWRCAPTGATQASHACTACVCTARRQWRCLLRRPRREPL